jgi:hypothetical protein
MIDFGESIHNIINWTVCSKSPKFSQPMRALYTTLACPQLELSKVLACSGTFNARNQLCASTIVNPCRTRGLNVLASREILVGIAIEQRSCPDKYCPGQII